MNFVSMLYKAARTANSIRAVVQPKRLPGRIKNIVVGRLLGKVGFWKALWK